MPAYTPNIGPLQRRRRLRMGVAGLVVAIALAALLAAVQADALLRALVFVPLMVAGSGFFQYREKTWVRLAARGLRDMDGGAEPIRDAAGLVAVRRQATRVRWLTVATATVLTTLYVLFSDPGTLR